MRTALERSLLIATTLGFISGIVGRNIPIPTSALARDAACAENQCSAKLSSSVARRWALPFGYGNLTPRIELPGSPHESAPHDPTFGSPQRGSPSDGETHPDPVSPEGSNTSTESPAQERPLGLPEDPLPKLKSVFKNALEYIGPGGKKPLGKDKSVFNSGGDDPFEAAGTFAIENHLSDFGEVFDGFNVDEAATYEPDEEDEYNKLLSAAFARASSGEVRVFLPEGGLNGDGYFTKYEWPELVANGEVTKVTWIDPEDTSVTKVIWQAGDGQDAFPINKKPSEMGH